MRAINLEGKSRTDNIDFDNRPHACIPLKWSFFSQARLEGSGKNPKSGFFLLGLNKEGSRMEHLLSSLMI